MVTYLGSLGDGWVCSSHGQLHSFAILLLHAAILERRSKASSRLNSPQHNVISVTQPHCTKGLIRIPCSLFLFCLVIPYEVVP